MSVLEIRGGVPRVRRETVDTTGRGYRLPFWCKYLIIRATSNPCRMYFTEDDWTNDVNYVLVPVAAAATPHGEWQGPVEAQEVWLRGEGGSSNVELVVFQRRG